jgi:hypothetical protein
MEHLRATGFFVNWPTPSTERAREEFQPIELKPGSKTASEILLEDRR